MRVGRERYRRGGGLLTGEEKCVESLGSSPLQNWSELVILSIFTMCVGQAWEVAAYKAHLSSSPAWVRVCMK